MSRHGEMAEVQVAITIYRGSRHTNRTAQRTVLVQGDPTQSQCSGLADALADVVSAYLGVEDVPARKAGGS